MKDSSDKSVHVATQSAMLDLFPMCFCLLARGGVGDGDFYFIIIIILLFMCRQTALNIRTEKN